MTRPPPWVGPENDYRGVAELEEMANPRVSVVIPAHERPDELARTLAGFSRQSMSPEGFEVIVVDDGSEADLKAVVSGFGERLAVRYFRQERRGFGAHRARNLGAREAIGEVVLFVDADCIPAADLVHRHQWWHRRAVNLVVTGARRHVDATGTTAADLAEGLVDPEALPYHREAGEPDHSLPQDWRRLFYRRSKMMLIGDAAFRAAVSSNLSVWRHRLDEVGGFSEVFPGWGGEDTELGWRLWNHGAFIVPENRAVVHHQVVPGDQEGWRQEARQQSLPLVTDLIPHRFYRHAPTPLASVPKLTWLVQAGTRDEADRMAGLVGRSPVADVELLLVGPPEAIAQHRAREAVGGRVRVFDGEERILEAISSVRGELTLIVDGRVRFLAGIVEKAMGRFDGDPRLGLVRVSYQIADGVRYRRLADLIEVDAVVARVGLPLWAMVRTRELRKDPQRFTDVHQGWRSAVERCRVEFLMHHTAALDTAEAGPKARAPGPADLASAPARLMVKDVARKIRAGPADGDPQPPASSLIGIEYVGFTEHDNLGDEAVLSAVRSLTPWAEVGREVADPRMLMLGGGTLVNGNRYYLTRILRHDRPDLERAVFGVGVRDPGFHGITEPMEEWWSFFSSSVYVGVRGPESVRHLRHLGYRGEVEVVGDPALSLAPSQPVERVPGRVVMCPVWTDGNLLGGEDEPVFAALATVIRRMRDEGREVVMLSAFPKDDRYLIELMRTAGEPDMPYVAGYANLDETLELIASADLVVAERLHAAILAAACTTPFVALEYWPKARDFARSLGLEELVIRTDALGDGSLERLVDSTLNRADEVIAQIESAVGRYRGLQREAAQRIHEALSLRES